MAAENLHAWAHGAFRPARLSGTPLPELRRAALARREAGSAAVIAGMSLGTAAIAGLGVLGGGIVVGYLIGRWWKRRREEQAARVAMQARTA